MSTLPLLYIPVRYSTIPYISLEFWLIMGLVVRQKMGCVSSMVMNGNYSSNTSLCVYHNMVIANSHRRRISIIILIAFVTLPYWYSEFWLFMSLVAVTVRLVHYDVQWVLWTCPVLYVRTIPYTIITTYMTLTWRRPEHKNPDRSIDRSIEDRGSTAHLLRTNETIIRNQETIIYKV